MSEILLSFTEKQIQFFQLAVRYSAICSLDLICLKNEASLTFQKKLDEFLLKLGFKELSPFRFRCIDTKNPNTLFDSSLVTADLLKETIILFEEMKSLLSENATAANSEYMRGEVNAGTNGYVQDRLANFCIFLEELKNI